MVERQARFVTGLNVKTLLVFVFVLMSQSVYRAPRVPRFAYVANNQDNTVSIFSIHQAGLRAIRG